MEKITLVGVSYDVLSIEGLDVLVPSRLRPFERSARTNIEKIVNKLKVMGWYDYVLVADMITVVVPSPPNEQFTLVQTSNQGAHRPIFFMDSGGIIKRGTSWNASQFIHEATHVFQRYYLSDEEHRDRRKREQDACREQLRFLRCSRCIRMVRNLRKLLKKPRGWWEWEDAPLNKEERYDAERAEYCDRIFDELMPHIHV